MTNNRFNVGDEVRIDIPDKNDPDHDKLHRRRGTVIEILYDDADNETGDERDSIIYRVRIGHGEMIDLRWRDVRPP
jgi:hypothetical protein